MATLRRRAFDEEQRDLDGTYSSQTVDKPAVPLEHLGLMRKALLPVVLLVLSTSAAIFGAYHYFKRNKEPTKETLVAESFKLPNGLTTEILAGPCGETVAIAVLFRVGADHDPPGQSGMVHLIERVFSASLEPGRTQRIVQSGSDYFLYSVVTPVERLSAELEGIAARMSRVGFVQRDFETGRKQVLDNLIQRAGGDASLTAITYAAESIQPSRGGGRRGGIASEVEPLDLARVNAFWRASFTPRNAQIVIVGHVDREKLRATIQKAFGPLSPGKPPALRPPGESTVIGTLVIGEAPTSVGMAVPAPPPSDRLYPAFLVLAARLMREASAARTWSAKYEPVELAETLLVNGNVQPGEGAEPAAQRIRADVMKIVERPLTPADIAGARERFGLFLGLGDADPTTCSSDPRGLAIALARRAQLGVEKRQLARALEASNPQQLAEASALFGARRATAVIAGGAIR